MVPINLKRLLVPAFFAAFLIAILFVQPVRAEGETPADPVLLTETQPIPEVAESDTAALVEEIPAVTEEVSPATPVDETAAAEETPAMTEDVSPVTPVDETAVADTTAALEASGIQLVDEYGQAVIIRDSGEIPEGDPYFKVGTQIYHFLPNGVSCDGVSGLCFVASIEQNTPIQNALDYMAANNLTPSDRKLHLEEYNYSEYVNVDGTLNGVKGLTGIEGEDTSPAEVYLDGVLYIHDMPAGFSVSNITVENNDYPDDAAIWVEDNIGTLTLTDVKTSSTAEDASGITVLNNKGAVVLNRVESCGNAYKGLAIVTIDPTVITGPVTIMNSIFDNNLKNVYDGSFYYESEPTFASIDIAVGNSAAAITLNGVSASRNIGDGANLLGDKSLITVRNSVFDENDKDKLVTDWGWGLWIKSATSVLENINANNNDSNGIDVTASVSFTGTHLNTFNNGITGVSVYTCLGGSPCTNTGAGTVSIKNSSSVNNNVSGYYITAKGTVTLYDVYSGLNDGAGIEIYNFFAAPAPVTMTLVTANENQSGIIVYSKGAVTGSTVIANLNIGNGIYIDNTEGSGAGVTFNIFGNAPMVFNEAVGNGTNGLMIYSKGAVSLTNFDAYNNVLGNGVIINNSIATTPMPVTIKVIEPKTTINGFESNGGSGLSLMSRGAVTISNVSASYNNSSGMNIINRPATDIAGPAVTITSSYMNLNCPHDEDGNCVYAGSGFYGLMIESNGLITLKDVMANSNDGFGVFLNNRWPGATAGVTLARLTTGWNKYNYNIDYGLQANSNGAVSLAYVEAMSNQSFGARVSNVPISGTVNAPVTILNGNFNYNCPGGGEGCYSDGSMNHYGLDVSSRGIITLTNIAAVGNYGRGAYLANLVSGSTAAVNLLATAGMGNTFCDNNGTGLEIVSNGAVTVNNIIAYRNSGFYGLKIYNAEGTGAVAIKQTAGWTDYTNNWWPGNAFNENGNEGVNIVSSGAVALAFYQAKGNNGSGIMINTDAPLGAVSVSGLLSDYNENVAYNQSDGIHIQAWGNVLLNNLDARYNWNGFGVSLTNFYGTGGVTINNGYFDSNNDGLLLISNGAVIWKNGSASDNYLSGAFICNSYSNLAGKPVTISNVNTSWNGESGLYIVSKGAVLLTHVQSDSNSADWFQIQMNEEWHDNLNYDQSWIFQAPDSGVVVISVSSTDFNPGFTLEDPYGDVIALVHGTDGLAELLITDPGILTPGNTYYIKVTSDEWVGQPYLIRIHDPANPPTGYYAIPNETYGIYVNNAQGLNAPVTISNTNSKRISNNSTTNVEIESSGAVTLTNLELNDSGNNGLLITNVNSTIGSGVTLTNIQTYNNLVDGMRINTKGAVVIKSPDSRENGGYGISIQNANDAVASLITITGASTGSITGGNGESGLLIIGNGAVTLTNLYSRWNGSSGMEIYTQGAVTFTKVEASYNQGSGARVVTAGTFTIVASPDRFNFFLQNISDGLDVEAGGKITIAKVDAFGNGRDTGFNYVMDADGIHLVNTNALGTAPIVLTNLMTDGNTEDGLECITRGAVTITKLSSKGNSYQGLRVDQTAALNSLYPILLTDLQLEGNGSDGAEIASLGNIIVSKFNANFNNGYGLLLTNFNKGTVTILAPTLGATMNNALSNAVGGVYIASNGAVIVNALETSGTTGGTGLWISNSTPDPLTAPAVTLNKVISRYNTSGSGIYVVSDGLVTINNSWANANENHGIEVSTTGNVLMTNTGSINNGWAGIWAEQYGTGKLTLNNCTWFGNLRNGTYTLSGNLYATAAFVTIL
jgi:hypothetical protein